MRRGLLPLLLTLMPLCLLPNGNGAEKLRRLAEDLRLLRRQMEAKRKKLLEEIDRLERQTAAKQRMLNSLKEETEKADDKIGELRREIEALKRRLAQTEHEHKTARLLLEQARRRFNAAVLSSIPFRRAERTIPPKESLGRLFDAVVEGYLNDVSIACCVEAYRDILSVDGRRLRGYMVRLGLVGMVFAADSGEAAVWTRSGWKVQRSLVLWRAIKHLAEQALKRSVPKIVPAPVPAEIVR